MFAKKWIWIRFKYYISYLILTNTDITWILIDTNMICDKIKHFRWEKVQLRNIYPHRYILVCYVIFTYYATNICHHIDNRHERTYNNMYTGHTIICIRGIHMYSIMAYIIIYV